jgi:hypothetical protein
MAMDRSAPPIDPPIVRNPDPSSDPSTAGPGTARPRTPRRDPWPILAALGVLALIALVTFLSLRGVPSAAERAAAEAERERIVAEQIARDQAAREQAEREAAERALAEAEALAAGGDHLAARDAFLEVARAGGELAAIALERARESGAIYVEESMKRLEELLADERTAEALVHLQDTLAELRGTPEVEAFLEGARALTSELSAQLGPAWRALVEVLRAAANG